MIIKVVTEESTIYRVVLVVVIVVRCARSVERNLNVSMLISVYSLFLPHSIS